MERTGLIIVYVQVLLQVYFISLGFFFFFLGNGHKITALQINVYLVFTVKAYYAQGNTAK